MDNVNLVSILIIAAAASFILRGAFNDFQGERMFRSVTSSIDNFSFMISLLFSIYVTNKIFSNQGSEGILGKIQDITPARVMAFSQDLGILIYLVFTPIILIVIFFLLSYIRSTSDSIVRKLSSLICDKIKGTSRFTRALMGAVIGIPKALISVFVIVFMLALLINYYPASKLASFARRSRPYNLVYTQAVSHLMESSFGERIPVFIQYSANEISKGIASSKFIGESEGLKKIGFLRFQYETKSNEEIDAAAREIVGDERDERKMAYLLYRWIGSNIEYDWNKYENILKGHEDKDKFGAIPAFSTREGVCEDYSDLYVAMAKALGLRVRIIVGQGYSMGNWGGHAWNEVYIPKEDRWIPLDSTWASMGDYFDNESFYEDHKFEAVAGEW